MQTTTLGDLTVSAQGLGCMGMSEWYGHADWGESVSTIHRALDLGVTFLDTADIYGAGHNEVLVGRAIAGCREQVQLATKFGIDRSGGDGSRVVRGEPGYVKRACEASLLRLGVDVIDLYYAHRPPQTAEIEETVGAMAALVAEGKVRHLGLSEVDGDLLRRAYAVHPNHRGAERVLAVDPRSGDRSRRSDARAWGGFSAVLAAGPRLPYRDRCRQHSGRQRLSHPQSPLRR